MSSRQADALHGVPKRKGPRWKENTKGPKSLRSDGPRSMARSPRALDHPQKQAVVVGVPASVTNT